MCVAVPVRIASIEGATGTGELGGAKTRVNLTLLDDVRIGDYVLLHAGFAISKMDAKDAEELLELLSSIQEAGLERP